MVVVVIVVVVVEVVVVLVLVVVVVVVLVVVYISVAILVPGPPHPAFAPSHSPPFGGGVIGSEAGGWVGGSFRYILAQAGQRLARYRKD